jgi:glycosyltransferase involved in cell wall biosynthesis
MISIITPTYNRKNIINISILSSLKLVLKINGEVIVIDDCSIDGTSEYLKKKYRKWIVSKKLKIYKQSKNLGMIAARNYGIKKARFNWLVLMDDDDKFVNNISSKFKLALHKLKDYDLIFFRCQDLHSKKLIGSSVLEGNLSFFDLINKGTPGECLPVIKKSKLPNNSFSGSRVDGGNNYCKILFAGGKSYLSNLIVREYNTIGNDRMSNFSQRIRNSEHLLKYHLTSLKFFNFMMLNKKIKVILSIIFYFFFTFIYNANK